MGRPIRKVKFGTWYNLAATPATGANLGIKCEAYLGGSNRTDAYIIKQVGSKKFKVTNEGGDGTTRAVLSRSANPGPAYVAGTTPAADGDMRITGYVAGTGANTNPATSGGTPKYAAKITQRRFIASDGTRYKWTLVNDSTQDYIELTAI